MSAGWRKGEGMGGMSEGRDRERHQVLVAWMRGKTGMHKRAAAGASSWWNTWNGILSVTLSAAVLINSLQGILGWSVNSGVQ